MRGCRLVLAVSVRQAIPLSQLTATDFTAKVEALPGARAQASTMQHAIRHHIDLYFAEDPAAYQSLLERLTAILRDYAEQWERPAFWQIVGRAMPDFISRRTALDQYGAQLWLPE